MEDQIYYSPEASNKAIWESIYSTVKSLVCRNTALNLLGKSYKCDDMSVSPMEGFHAVNVASILPELF